MNIASLNMIYIYICVCMCSNRDVCSMYMQAHGSKLEKLSFLFK